MDQPRESAAHQQAVRAALADCLYTGLVPVQVVQGAKDPFFPLVWTEEMLQTFGGPAQLHPIERGRLLAHEECAVETAEALLPTLLTG